MADDSIAQDQLRSIIERIEHMETEKAAVADDIKAIYAEAKGNGFDTKIVRQIIRIRKQDPNERQEQEALLELYLAALGMLNPGSEEGPEGSDQDDDARPRPSGGYHPGFDTDGTA